MLERLEKENGIVGGYNISYEREIKAVEVNGVIRYIDRSLVIPGSFIFSVLDFLPNKRYGLVKRETDTGATTHIFAVFGKDNEGYYMSDLYAVHRNRINYHDIVVSSPSYAVVNPAYTKKVYCERELKYNNKYSKQIAYLVDCILYDSDITYKKMNVITDAQGDIVVYVYGTSENPDAIRHNIFESLNTFLNPSYLGVAVTNTHGAYYFYNGRNNNYRR